MSIGLDKNTKLLSVFRRFVDFCNEVGAGSSGGSTPVCVTDLEFVHSQLLNGHDTAEASALMKDDRILVRKVQTAKRRAEAERNRIQREADRQFFRHMRLLMPDDSGGPASADVILDCRGTLPGRDGRGRRTSRGTLPANSAIIGKRCRWLSDIIQRARAKAREEAADKVKEEEEGNKKTPDTAHSGAAEIKDDEGVQMNGGDMPEGEATSAAKIEPEEDPDDDDFGDAPARAEEDTADVVSLSQHQGSRSGSNLLVVTLPDHPAEAVQILLEYCYTNRVFALGHDAFVQACRTRPTKHQGPVAGERWPINNGSPTVTFHVALAATYLAEEAGMPRLSLMCEISASRLLSPSNFMEALSMCANQRDRSGNCLPRLRKAAMDIILANGPTGVAELCRSTSFRAALEEQRSVLVPTLLQGTMEAVLSFDKSRGTKRDGTELRYTSFEELDKVDAVQRENERRKRRQERPRRSATNRNEHVYDSELDDLDDPFFAGWAAETAKRSMTRMSRHLASLSRRNTPKGSFSFPAAAGSRRPSRRRSTQS